MYMQANVGSEGANRRAQRAEDVLAMQRAARKDGTRSLLRWLADRTGTRVGLIDAAGAAVPLDPAEDPDGEAAELIRRGLREIASRRLRSMAIDGANHTVLLFPLDAPRGVRAPALAAVAHRPVAAHLPTLLADAASALSLCWQAEHAERLRRRTERAEGRSREAVLHLLMNGHFAAAHQVAGALYLPLPPLIRFYVVQCPPRVREQLSARCTEVAEDAWVVPCPVHVDHILVIASAGTPALEEIFAELTDDCLVGASEELPLRDTATGYAQAFHALAAARNQSVRHARFAGRPDLALAIGPAAATWAKEVLAPLRAHSAKRSQDPDSGELMATAVSWLTFSSQATAHLKIHRNTLSARLKHIAELLDLNLDRLADQSLLALALRADGIPCDNRDAGTTRSLDDLLLRPAAVAWAHQQLHPIRTRPFADELDRTLTTYLSNDGRLGPTAAMLSISATATRKRLARIEALLERSLLRSPSARYDLWLAQRALTLAEGG
ncbi:helix-turn-helix domain-containing protein [Streptomyces orinoci]|uniref:Helix-turn-helix domain-containing protein n=1 Tax=Streptomyces orinoci TaxID=67339 RepID=A0ABV3K630_STRON|nr:helix-turn-helix domain-containing protein [Streptomyces orinoci]